MPDPDRFYWNARDRGTGTSFFRTPCYSTYWSRPTESGSWPEGRLATFERACETLATETKPGALGQRWDGHPFAVEEVVLAAGRLCSILLLCGNSGWSRRGPGDDEYPALSEAGAGAGSPEVRSGQQTLRGGRRDGQKTTAPANRGISGCRGIWIIAIRDRAVPATRVLAWMRGIDGIVTAGPARRFRVAGGEETPNSAAR